MSQLLKVDAPLISSIFIIGLENWMTITNSQTYFKLLTVLLLPFWALSFGILTYFAKMFLVPIKSYLIRIMQLVTCCLKIRKRKDPDIKMSRRAFPTIQIFCIGLIEVGPIVQSNSSSELYRMIVFSLNCSPSHSRTLIASFFLGVISRNISVALWQTLSIKTANCIG